MLKPKSQNSKPFFKFKYFLIFLFFLFSLTTNYHFLTTIFAEPNCDSPGPSDIDFCLEKIQRDIEALKPAHEYNKKELSDLRKEIEDFKKKILAVSKEIETNEQSIAKKEEDLAYAEEIFEEKIKNHYKFVRLYDPVFPLFSSHDVASAFKEIVLREKAANEDVRIMERYVQDLIKLKEEKEKLEQRKLTLGRLKTQVESRANFLAKEVEKTENYLASLTAKQEELLALKAGGFQTSVGETPPTFEPCSGAPGTSNFCDPGIRPAFAAFSFGAPHRKGMSQYGALGRAKRGQNYETILRAYYGDVRIVDVNTSLTIKTSAGSMDFETRYMMGIAEMPSSWADEGGFEALKAQAIAARSYALAYVGWRMGNQNPSGTICITESCQVWKSSKAGNPGRWREAVEQTRGKILVSNATNDIVNSWYASTAGGFTFSYSSLGHTTPGGWDTPAGKDAWPEEAWDKIGGSPWFYKAWYRTRSGASCGRGNPWLSSEEMADILNAWYVLYKGGGDVSRVSPQDKSCWNGNPYSKEELAAIGGFRNVSGVSVVYSNSGYTQSVFFETNKGRVEIPGEEFKKAFNLRAPGYIGLKSSLFNIEKL